MEDRHINKVRETLFMGLRGPLRKTWAQTVMWTIAVEAQCEPNRTTLMWSKPLLLVIWKTKIDAQIARTSQCTEDTK